MVDFCFGRDKIEILNGNIINLGLKVNVYILSLGSTYIFFCINMSIECISAEGYHYSPVL